MTSFIIKFKRIIMILILFVLLSSCSLVSNFYNINNVNISKYINNIENEIIRCLNTKDMKSLKKLFCLKIRDTEYLDKEMSIVFEFIEQNGGIKIEDVEWEEPFEHGRNTINDRVKYIGAIKKRFILEKKNMLLVVESMNGLISIKNMKV